MSRFSSPFSPSAPTCKLQRMWYLTPHLPISTSTATSTTSTTAHTTAINGYKRHDLHISNPTNTPLLYKWSNSINPYLAVLHTQYHQNQNAAINRYVNIYTVDHQLIMSITNTINSS